MPFQCLVILRAISPCAGYAFWVGLRFGSVEIHILDGDRLFNQGLLVFDDTCLQSAMEEENCVMRGEYRSRTLIRLWRLVVPSMLYCTILLSAVYPQM